MSDPLWRLELNSAVAALRIAALDLRDGIYTRGLRFVGIARRELEHAAELVRNAGGEQ